MLAEKKHTTYAGVNSRAGCNLLDHTETLHRLGYTKKTWGWRQRCRMWTSSN